jgi:hypothetical protein
MNRLSAPARKGLGRTLWFVGLWFLSVMALAMLSATLEGAMQLAGLTG